MERISSSTHATCVEARAIDLTAQWEQAAQQIDDNWTLHRVGQPDVQPWDAFLVSSGLARVGMDAFLIGHAVVPSLRARLHETELVLSADENLVDIIWTDRPPLEFPPIRQHPLVFAGRTVPDKLRALREDIDKARAAATVLTNLTEIAWLLNLRGSSIPFVPVFHAYLVVTRTAATLYAGPHSKARNEELRRYLHELGIEQQPYDTWPVWEPVAELAEGRNRVRRRCQFDR